MHGAAAKFHHDIACLEAGPLRRTVAMDLNGRRRADGSTAALSASAQEGIRRPSGVPSIQYRVNYCQTTLRSCLVPVVNIGCKVRYFPPYKQAHATGQIIRHWHVGP